MKTRVITISREFGSGGHEVARLLSEKLGIEFYDKAIIEQVSSKTALPASFIAQKGEYSKGISIFSNFFGGDFSSDASMNDYIYEMQKKVIYELAEKGPCILVGRCADYYLREWEHVFHVFIYADMSSRIQRIHDLYNVSEKEAASMIQSIDKKRRLNYQYCTNQRWGDRTNYDIMLNTSTFGIEKTAQILLNTLP